MKKRSTLLKVMSIILIVLGVLSLLGSIFMLAMRSSIEQMYATMGLAVPSTISYVISLVGSIIFLVSGIIGIMYKSKKSVLVMGILLAIYYAADMILAVVSGNFTAFSLFALIWPLLYLWGWYQSN